jgi:quercetin dioxygenase-like cupin family protein
VIEGEVEVKAPGGDGALAGIGHLLEFEPGERHTVSAKGDATILLLLTPWPGDGHPGAMTLEQKAEVRERAAQHQET